jgi:lycopene beta-cyclase
MTSKDPWWLQVEKVTEEEYCLIPMGGVLPKHDQRVIGVGGTAGLVHPSTGYMVARTLGAVPQLADRIVDELSRPLPDSRQTGATRQTGFSAVCS